MARRARGKVAPAWWCEMGIPACDDELELALYTEDVGAVPSFLKRLARMRVPEAVFRPRTTAEAAELVRACAREGLPLTPRGGASGGFGSVLPVRGAVVDTCGLRQGPELDARRRLVRAGAGWTFAELDHWLARRGYALPCYPSSAPAATLGGWLAGGGYGVGTLRSGPFVAQVSEAEVVLPDGRVEVSRAVPSPGEPGEGGPLLSWLTGSEGTLGLVTSLTVRVDPMGERRAILLGAPEGDDGVATARLLEALGNSDRQPFCVHFAGTAFNRLVAQVDGQRRQGGWPGEPRGTVEVWLHGPGAEVQAAEEVVREVSLRERWVDLGAAAAEAAWQDRFRALRIRRSGPSLVGTDLLLPARCLGDFLRACQCLAARYRVRLVHYGYLVAPGTVLLMLMLLCDERDPFRYVGHLGLVGLLTRLGFRYGARPYGVGLWNSAFVSQSTRRVLRQRKRMLDPGGLLSPGKMPARPWFMHPVPYRAGSAVMALLLFFGGARGAEG
ncbi:MAG: FAD-binding oxidoreductase [Bacillota bacterium]